MTGGRSIVFTQKTVMDETLIGVFSNICTIETFQISKNKKNDSLRVDEYCDHCKPVFEAMGGYYFFYCCQETQPTLSDDDIEKAKKNRWII